jgi:hypothetical protein
VSQAEAPRLDVPRILGSLRRHRVDFVVIGAIAAIAQGYPLPTQDLDVTPDPRPDNLEPARGVDTRARGEAAHATGRS